MSGADELRKLAAQSESMVAFTGAGISAESGIQTYRGDDGVWNRYDPRKYANINHFFKDPSYYWSFFKEVRFPALSRARPNPAHLALAGLESRGRLKAVITQNIDGLHQLAGSGNVLELHGNTRRFSCLSCGNSLTLEEVYHLLHRELPPVCPQCQGTLKPDVVFFGESLPVAVLNRARDASRECDLFLVVGSSLVVQPAASLPVMAKDNGAWLVIVNKDQTPLDHMADLVIRESATRVLADTFA